MVKRPGAPVTTLTKAATVPDLGSGIAGNKRSTGATKMRQGRLPSAVKGLVGVVVAAIAWELVRQVAGLSRSLPSLPSIVGATMKEMWQGSLLLATVETLRVTAVAALLAVLIGVPVGLFIGRSALGDHALRPLFELLRPIPSVAFIPVAIIALGRGFTTGVFAAAFASVWLVIFNTKVGVENQDPLYVDVARVLGLSRTERWTRIILPAALPSISTGVRLATTTALVVTITAEIVVGWGGLGHYLESARQVGDASAIWTGVLIAGVLGYLLNVGLLAVHKKLLAWNAAVAR